MGRILTSARRAATKMSGLFSRERRQIEQSTHASLSPEEGVETQDPTPHKPNARSAKANDLAGPSSPAPLARPFRPTASAGFRFLATNNSTSTVSSCSFEDTASFEHRHRHPASDDDDSRRRLSSAADASDDHDPRLQERSDTSSLFGTNNPWHTSAARGPKTEEKPRKLRLPSFVRNRAAEQREVGEEAPKRIELGEDEEWELHPNEVGPIQFSSHDLFAQITNDDLRPRRVDKRHSI